VANWKPADVRALWAQFEREEIGARTRRAIHATIHSALGDAVRDGLILSNPLDAVKSPRERATKQKTLSPSQVRDLLESVDAVESPQSIALVTLIASTGLRIGEALGLRWEDLDLTTGDVHIRRNLAELSGKFHETDPKTEASRRTVTLPRRAVAKLRAHRAALGAVPLGRAIVFHDRRGGWLRRSNLLRRMWHPLLIEAELPQVGWHALRHAHATALLTAGEPVTDVSERLGHNNPAVTLRIYAHAIPGRAREVAKRVDEILG
jgi:integrase